VAKLTYQSMDEHRTAQDVKVHQDGDVGSSGVKNGRGRDSMLATDDAESDRKNMVPAVNVDFLDDKSSLFSYLCSSLMTV
jgi:hypothetical protein